MTRRRCAYCGEPGASTKDHVVPRALYPHTKPSKAKPQVQRITVPACSSCNKSWSQDEPHFRDMLLLCGEHPSPIVRELWEGKTRRSFDQPDGRKRVRDLIAQFVPAPGNRHMVFPANDARVMRLVRKVIRGLSFHHGLRWPVADDEVWADILRFEVPADLIANVRTFHVGKAIVQYRFGRIEDDPDLESWWLVRFFDRVPFVGVVDRAGARHIVAL